MNFIYMDNVLVVVGFYSQVISMMVIGCLGEMVFCFGQILLVLGGQFGEMFNDIVEQIVQVLDNFMVVLLVVGCD